MSLLHAPDGRASPKENLGIPQAKAAPAKPAEKPAAQPAAQPYVGINLCLTTIVI